MIQNLPNEVWKPIPGYGGFFEISNMQRIKSKERMYWNGHRYCLCKEKIRKQTLSYGYKVCSFAWPDGKQVVRVHRLIANAFIPNPENKTQVNHKNGIRSDNRIENLEWNTPYENQRHSFEVLGRSGGRLGDINNLKQSKPIKCDTFDMVFPSTMEARRQLGVHNIMKVLSGERNHTYGLVFRYI